MHLHYFLLHHLGEWLDSRIRGAVLAECFSQDKDELVLGFGIPDENIWLRVGCNPSQPFICPLTDYRKAKKNLAEIFPESLGAIVKNIEVPKWERALVIHFENDSSLILKMHGNQSNVIFSKEGKPISIFRDNLKKDFEFVPSEGFFLVEWKKYVLENPGKTPAEIMKEISPSMDKQFLRAVEREMKEGKTFSESLESILNACAVPEFSLVREGTKPMLFLKSLAPASGKLFSDVASALQAWLRVHFVFSRLAKEYLRIKNILEQRISKMQSREHASSKGLTQLRGERIPEEIGNVLMAHLHLIQPGEKEIELEDFYSGGLVKIKLDPALNAQQNAAAYYSKGKKRKIKEKFLEEECRLLNVEIVEWENTKKEFDILPDPATLELEPEVSHAALSSLEKFVQRHKEFAEEDKEGKNTKKHSFMEFTSRGFSIFAGRNAKNNDELTFHFSKRDDLWLHARDVSGSHVIIRQRSGMVFPKPVIEFAASIAAKFSKRKTESLVPVAFTLRKFVRKPKGSMPGEVLVEKEETVMVTPAE